MSFAAEKHLLQGRTPTAFDLDLVYRWVRAIKDEVGNRHPAFWKLNAMQSRTYRQRHPNLYARRRRAREQAAGKGAR